MAAEIAKNLLFILALVALAVPLAALDKRLVWFAPIIMLALYGLRKRANR